MNKTTSKTFACPVNSLERQQQRFDLVLRGVHHLGCSYEGRVFLNNPDADEKTERSADNGFAGSYYVFGHGDCYGAPGHCGPPPPRLPYDTTPPPDSRPIEVHLDISEALQRAAQSTSAEGMALTIVPVVKGRAPGVQANPEDVGKIDGPISIVSYA